MIDMNKVNAWIAKVSEAKAMFDAMTDEECLRSQHLA